MTKKRLIALLLVAVLALSLVVAPSAEAADAYTIRLTDASGNSEITAEPGDTVVLSLSIENNPGILSVGAQMAYPSQLTLTKAELPATDMVGMIMSGNFSPQFYNSQYLTENPYLVWMNQATGTLQNKLVTYNGKIHELTFQIADNAADGAYTIAVSAPADKNATADVDGSGTIITNTNTKITDIVTVSFTINIGEQECAPEDHTWGEWTDVEGSEPTCDEGGKQSHTCTTCGKEEEKDVDALGHSYTQYTESKPATCVDDKEETATCDNGCGETDIRTVAGTATGEHSFQDQPYIDEDPATCLANGTHYRECSVCDAKEEATEIENSKLDHAYTGTELTYKATDANCHTKATYYHVCVNGCNGQGTTTFEAGEFDATKHDGETQLRNAEPATEQAPGYTGDLYCLGCDGLIQEGEDIPQLDHTHQMSKVTANEESCTEPGNIEYYTCTKCGKLYNDELGTVEYTQADVEIPAAHDLTKVDAKPKSCTANGNIEHYKCTACNKLFADENGANEISQSDTVIAKGHDLTKVDAKPKSCTENGVREHYRCNGTCGRLYRNAAGTQIAPDTWVTIKASHSLSKVDAQPKSCTQPGNIEHYACSACYKTFANASGTSEIADVVIPASHELSKVDAEPKTCTQPGKIEHYACSECNKTFSDENGANEIADVVIPASHELTKVDAEPKSCTANGNIEYYVCSDCGKLFSDANGTNEIAQTDTVVPASHDITKVDAEPKSCTENGNIEHYKCTACNKLFSDAAGANEIAEADTVVPASHEIGEVNAKPKSCTEPGNIAHYACSDCSKTFSDAAGANEIADVTIPASHELSKVNAEPKSCTQPGKIEHYACSDCNKTFSDENGANEVADVTVPASHELTKVDAQPKSCTQPGNIEYYVCSDCGKLFSDANGTNEIALADTVVSASHEIGKVDAEPKSCTQNGNTEHYKCSDCNKLFPDAAGANEIAEADVVIPASHELTKVNAEPKSCTQPGNIEHYVCSECDKTFSDANGANEVADVTVPASHELTKIAAEPATCTEPGNIEYYNCSVCQKNFSDAEGKTEVAKTAVDALGHKTEKVEAKAASCDEQGNIAHYVCVNGCDAYYADAACTTVLAKDKVVKAALGHKLVENKANNATTDAEGNIAYYECETCDKLYKDAEGKAEVKKEDTVLPKLPKPESATPANGDSFNASLWIAVMLLACLSLAVTVVIRKKVIC